MKITSLKTMVPAVLFGMALSVPSFAQDAPASTDMHQAGQEMKQAGSDTAAAAKDTFHGTERPTKDTAITAKVKTAFMRDRNVGASGIHVDTVAGYVTLKGNVNSPERAQRAAELAQQIDGVKGVNNQLVIVSSSASN